VLATLRRALQADERIGYALVFGSVARGTSHAGSDLDVAVAGAGGRRLTTLELGDVASRLETATGRPVDVVALEDAPPGLAYRIFRDGTLILERDRAALVARKARAILEYLDFQPIEELCAKGVLAAARRGR
jgi:predicted nucleotidyltransferase